VGFIGDQGPVAQAIIANRRVLGTTTDLERLVSEQHVDRIVVGMADRRGSLPTDSLLQAKLSGIAVEDAVTAYERMTGKILLDHVNPSWLIFSNDFRVSRWARLSKRTFDLAAATIVALLAWPLMLVTALGVYLESGGPVLYEQERVGKSGRTFVLRKFRSMRVDAEQGTPVWARSKDDRVTRVGRFIRLTRLDELPQLWNVIRGEMSIVGPRPERPFFVDQLQQQIPYYRQRHAVRPGLTGWAQVCYRYGSSVEDAAEKLRYDLYYIKHLSVGFDVTILLDTVKVILSRKGAL
jgi:sugar transferase (PEP-CTERM system associated)